MKKRAAVKLLVVVMGVMALVLSACGSKAGTEGAVGNGETKEFIIHAKNYEFDLKEIKVKQGDTVKVTLINTEGNHAVKFDGYNQTVYGKKTIAFTADQTGEFKYYCSIFCGTGHDKMVGKLIVE